MPFLPYFVCETTDCPLRTHATWLPFPNPPDKKPNQGEWPKGDWKAILVCPGCFVLRLYREPQVDWTSLDQKQLEKMVAEKSWFAVTLECASGNCEPPVRLHIPLDKHSTSTKIFELLNSGVVKSNLPCGHRFQLPANFHFDEQAQPIPSV